MADDTAAPAANDTPTPVAAPTGAVSVDDAAAFLRARREGVALAPKPEAPEPAAEAEPDSSQEEDAAAADEQHPGETDESDPAGEPPIAPPKSWTKAEKDAFASLPREHQQSIVDRETERESYYRKGHDEAARERQAAQAEKQAAEQARQQYEQALPSLLQSFQAQFATEFQDITTWPDVEAMQENDPLRFQRWTLAREKGQTLQREAEQAQYRQRQEGAKRWQDYVATEDAAFIAKAPEFKDPKKTAALAAEAGAMFKDLGFSQDEINGAWEHGQPISLRDHRVQLLARDAMRYRAAQKAAKAAQPKPVPPVQRPGVATSRGESSTTHIRDLTNKVKSTGSVDAAVALLRARRNAAARA